MGYAPNGIQGEAIKMSERRKELVVIEKYLLEHPNVKEYKGMTIEKVKSTINDIDNFEFLS